jgi:translation initiation factor 1
MKKNARLVYSTDGGRVEPERAAPVRHGAADGFVRVRRVTAGRRGKAVIVIDGLGLDDVALAALASEMKRSAGSGGTVRGGTIEIQGDHRARVIEMLVARGYRVKR